LTTAFADDRIIVGGGRERRGNRLVRVPEAPEEFVSGAALLTGGLFLGMRYAQVEEPDGNIVDLFADL
jgi:hypothetical protein